VVGARGRAPLRLRHVLLWYHRVGARAVRWAVRGRLLLAGLVLAGSIACQGATRAPPSAEAPVTPTKDSPPVLKQILLDLVGEGDVPHSPSFTTSGSSVNVCWRVATAAATSVPAVSFRLVDAATQGELATTSNAGSDAGNLATGCRTLPVPSPGLRYHFAVAAAADTFWHLVVTGR
jgi:hypothetical protein